MDSRVGFVGHFGWVMFWSVSRGDDDGDDFMYHSPRFLGKYLGVIGQQLHVRAARHYLLP